MAEIFHIRCRHCNAPFRNGNSAYCQPCNTYLMYRAMPLLLGMLLIPPQQLQPAKAAAKSHFFRGRSQPYPHLHEIMD